MLIDFLKTIPDHRDPQGREFQLCDVLLVSILAILAGARSYTDIARFAEARLLKLRDYFGIPWKRVLHFSAIRKIIIGLDVAAFEAAFRAWAKTLETNDFQQVRTVHFDGKALCGSFSHVKSSRPEYIFQVFASANKLILASVAIGDKDNEIIYFQQMIKELDLKDVYITADAMHCQKKTFELAEEVGAHLVVQLKGNQESLAEQVKHGCRVQTPLTFRIDPLEKGHGRLEQRTYEVFSALPMLKHWQKDWPYIRHVIRVTRMREVLKKDSKPTTEVSYYVTNATEQDVSIYAHVIRSHWSIENANHYVRDTAFDEDGGIRRKNPSLFARIISCASNIMRASGSTNMRGDIYLFSMDFDKMMNNVKKFLG